MKFKNKVLQSLNEPCSSEDTFLRDAEELGDDDDEFDARHSQLLESIAALNRRPKERRTEASATISEHNLNSTLGSKLKVHELIKTAKDSTDSIKKQFRKVEKKRLLNVPLVKPVVEKITRQTNYAVASKEVSKWNSLVEANRNADQLEFPLNEPSALRMDSSQEFVKRFKPSTDLEVEVHSLLSTSANNLSSERVLTEAEEKLLKAVSLEEARSRHKELQRMRALLSFQAAKMKRQKKIKSKTYHRLLKKDKLRKQLKEFEELKEKAPEEALKKLEELDKLRAMERASLKHKNTGKWAKQNLLRAKHDKTARDALSQQVELSKQLTQRQAVPEAMEEEKVENLFEKEVATETTKEEEKNYEPVDVNPWLRNAREALKAKQKADNKNNFSNSNNDLKGEQDGEELALDPNKFLILKSKNLKSSFPNLEENLAINEQAENMSEDDDDEQKQLIKEAFAEDDVINHFKEEKKDIIEKERPKDINLYLPGWGSWGGAGIQTNVEKQKAFTRKAPKSKRKDNNLGNVIISEKKDDVISKYMAKDLPFPFTNVSEFEKRVRNPIGPNWNSEIAFRSMTEPKVLTKMGKVIEPMSKEVLINYKIESEKKRLMKLEDIVSLE
ncbi:U3 small nucleolar RNA-associated protein 14 A-like protein [Dinothrombium tinctorium]|uniref:U3 small nucleolar RNA-associated protein 14 A-like protein n=3 Tax=Dinothrombium tinctorium TaxID=1965070 RepID=A0A443R2G1_9ACAR|nr:U3 small nucleolar RNA-associated protein 14 A-like protein [Dinothrombium tinctorium]